MSINRKASIAALLAAGAVVVGIVVGSHGFAHFDAALVGYAAGSVIAAAAIAYRFIVWAQRPPSRVYFERGWELLFRRLPASPSSAAKAASPSATTQDFERASYPVGAGTLGAQVARNFVAQDFIRRRGIYRWVMHLCLSGGCTLAFAITFPLVFGWIHFESLPTDASMYQVVAFGLTLRTMSVHSLEAALAFNALNIAGVLVLVGLIMAAARRITDPGERAVQTFFEDILPLVIIFAVTATGLALTVSYKFLGGRGHHLWVIVHMVSVVALLIYIPFGKLFHMFQRTCALCVARYKQAGAVGPRASCRCCGEDFASRMHVADLKTVLGELGFDYRFVGAQGEIHYQDICPPCRRRLVALNQGRTIGR